MADEKQAPDPVPAGWVRLTHADGSGNFDVPVSVIELVDDDIAIRRDANGYTVKADVRRIFLRARETDAIEVSETRAEVAALIAEAQRAQRRFDAVPVMAAGMYATYDMGTQDAVTQALAILDAIEAREWEAGR